MNWETTCPKHQRQMGWFRAMRLWACPVLECGEAVADLDGWQTEISVTEAPDGQ